MGNRGTVGAGGVEEIMESKIEWRKYPEEKPYKDDVYNVTVIDPMFNIVRSKLMAFSDGKFQNYGLEEEVIAFAYLPEPYVPSDDCIVMHSLGYQIIHSYYEEEEECR